MLYFHYFLLFIVTIDNIGLLLRKLKEVQYEAKEFGTRLGLKNSDINAVCKPNYKSPHECLQHMFSLWQKQSSEKRTWKKLVQALKLEGEQVIAGRIEKTHTLDQSGMIIIYSIQVLLLMMQFSFSST